MANPYIEMFKTPGSFAFSFFGLIARFPLAMDSLAIVTMISVKRGHYGMASSVAMLYVFTCAVLAPQMSRLADRFGQTRIAIPSVICTLCAMAALICAVHFNAPNWVLFVCAAFMGLMPNFGAFVRTRWSCLSRSSSRHFLHTAFAYESTIDEAAFMLGPVIVIFLATSFFPEAGLIGAAILLGFGGFFFCLQKKTEPAPAPKPAVNAAKSRPLIFTAPIALVTVILMAAGIIFGTAEVGAVAIGRAEGDPSGSMWPLAAYAFGSFIAGIIYGALKIRIGLARQFLFAIALTALTTLPLLAAHSIASLTVALLISGAACSPTIITAMRLMESFAPPEKMTEGMTWAMTGMAVGFAAGLTAAGHMVDRFGTGSVFYFAVLSGFAALLLVFAARGKIKKPPAQAPAIHANKTVKNREALRL